MAATREKLTELSREARGPRSVKPRGPRDGGSGDSRQALPLALVALEHCFTARLLLGARGWVLSPRTPGPRTHSRFSLEEEEGWPDLLPKPVPGPSERRQDIQVLRGLQSPQGHGSHHRSKGGGPAGGAP